MRNYFIKFIESEWYYKFRWFKLLIPISYIYMLAIVIRKNIQQYFSTTKSGIPIWVVGEITVGGSGKSPVIIWLSKMLLEQGFSPVIVCSGYKGSLDSSKADLCFQGSDYKVYGDEAVMLANEVVSPVVVAKKRNLAIDFIHKNIKGCNIIICDDGMQHYKMRRDKEIAVYNEQRIGNGYCFPAGPLREPKSRLKSVDLILNTKQDIELLPKCLSALNSTQKLDIDSFPRKVHAVAGIGEPDKFFKLLKSLGFDIVAHPFPDHHMFCEEDLSFDDNLPIVLTTKDAVKCTKFHNKNIWQLLFDVSIDKNKILEIL